MKKWNLSDDDDEPSNPSTLECPYQFTLNAALTVTSVLVIRRLKFSHIIEIIICHIYFEIYLLKLHLCACPRKLALYFMSLAFELCSLSSFNEHFSAWHKHFLTFAAWHIHFSNFIIVYLWCHWYLSCIWQEQRNWNLYGLRFVNSF